MRRSRQTKTSVLSSTKNQNTLAWSSLMFLTLVFQFIAFTANGNTTNDLTFTDCSTTSISGFTYMGEHNGSKYFCSNQNKTWSQAVALAQANGGHLAVVNNSAENSFLAANVIASVAWIGYTDEASEGNFHWYNGANSSYTNWTGSEPNNTDPTYTGADYAVIEKNSGDWYDRSGSNAYEVIMEIPCGANNNPTTTQKTCQLENHGESDNHPGIDRLVWIDFDGSGKKEYSVVGASSVIENTDGTAFITGTVEQVDNTCNKWEYSVKLKTKRTWSIWSGLGRSYKGNGSGDHTTWSYYELDNNNSTFTGKDCLSGKTLNLTHNPSDYEFGFQIGNGANDKDSDFGISGWFAFTGSYTGHGDFNGDLSNCVATPADCTPKQLVKYNMDACESWGGTPSPYDYSEFTPTYPNSGNCAAVSATGVFRTTTTVPHSCIEGYNGSGKATCFGVGGLTSFEDDSDLAIRFEVTLNPSETGKLTGLKFREMAPDYFHHISGNSGTNNYPKKYGIRVTKNGQEIFKETGINTTQSWSLETFDFSNLADFMVTTTSTFKFELLSYDPVSIGGQISAWDLDNIIIEGACCAAPATGSIGDLVFEDKNGNGIQETGELGIDGVTVMLLDANGDMVGTAQTTANGGQYLFSGLAAGDYKVKFTAPTGLEFTAANQGNNDLLDSDAVVMAGTADAMTEIVSLGEGDDILSLDAGLYTPAKLGNRIFEDTNGNGIQDTNEPGVDGVTVMLLDSNSDMITSVVTADDGLYEFAGLAPGTYKVKFPQTATTNTGVLADLTLANQGNNDAIDSDAVAMAGTSDAMSQLVTLVSGDNDDTIDAGYIPGKASIGDFVFEDKNGNGIQDAGEPGIDGVIVMLLDENGDMVGDAQTTANGGAYDFTDVAPGTYKVKFTAPTVNGVTAILTDAGQGNDETKDSDAIAMANSDDAMTPLITVNAGDDENDLDAGYYFPAKLGNFVFEDTNANGIQDFEPGIDGVTVMLLDVNGDMIASVETTNGGLYEFAGLAPGTYKVKFPQTATTNTGVPADLTSPNQGTNDAVDSDAVPMTGTTDAMSQLVTLASGDNDDTIDAGYIPGKASIGDVVFEDKNGNGIQDTDEPGLSDVVVMLLDVNGDMVGDAQITGTDGAYDFTNLAPGTYKVKFTAPTVNGVTAILTDANQGLDDTKDSDAVAMANSNDAMTQLVTVVVNDDINDVDAGYYFPAKLGNYVWEDADLDGIQDAGEGIEGVPVELRDAAGNTLDNTTTDENGLYEFAGLKPGDYKVVFPTEANVAGQDIILTKANQGGDDTVDSDAVPMAVVNEAMSQIVTLESGDNDDTIDAGYIAAAKLGDKAFIDENQNGLQDNTDAPLPGVTVTLTGTDIFGNDVSATQITDDNGEYLFTMLVPGTYEVQFSQPTTYVITRKDEFTNGFDFADSDISPLTGKTDPITLGSGEENRSVDGGFFIDPALPVALTSFEAQLINNSEVVLKWATASEEDNSHFVVERSLDGRDFESIGIVEGNGTTNQVNTYSLVDADPAYGYNYYRLKQVDFDGDYEFSHIETVIISSQDVLDVILYPNPVVKTTTLRVVTPFETDASIEVVDFTGKVLLNVVMAKGANSKQLDLSGFAAGTYFAYVNYNGHRELVHKIIKVEE